MYSALQISVKMKVLFIFLSVILFFGDSVPTTAEPVEDKQALLDFLHNLHHSHSLNWNNNSSVCNGWIGVTCNSDHSRVLALRLPGFGITGSIAPGTISRLSAIRVLSLRSNGLSGSFPSDLLKLGNLTDLYLQFNSFLGPLPSNFSMWKNLSVLDLSNNAFNGSIPPSMSNLTHLTSLNLSNNSFSGVIPDIDIPSLQSLNLSNNRLNGSVPRSLVRFPSSAFIGNNLSSGNSSPPAFPTRPPTPQPSKKTKRLGESAILGIVLGSCVLGFAAIAFMMICCYSKKDKEGDVPSKLQKKESNSKKKALERHEKNNKLVFFEGCNLAFDLEDLLRASAEVLGKGTFGTTYKAALEDANTVVVKRLKQVSVAKKELEQQMEVIGSIRHPNVSALRAYYFSKDEKLTVCDYYGQGSVSALLHGKRGEGRPPLDWGTRLKIAIGAARGIAYVHTQIGGKLVHGNIKASNTFLNSEGYGCISDVGLAAMMSSVAPQVMRAAGYRAPEITDSRKATHASDVYGFGVLLLELLTGKSPIHATGGEEVVHLVRWVHSVVREEWTAEVFDVELLRYPNIEEEMVEMLQIGMNCVVRMPEQRPKMLDVVNMVESVSRRSSDNLRSSEKNTEIAISTRPAPEPADVASASVSAPPPQ